MNPTVQATTWYTQEAMNPTMAATTWYTQEATFVISDINIFYATIGAIGLVGNMTSSIIFYKIRSFLSHSSSILFVHVTLVDTLFSLTLLVDMTTTDRQHPSPSEANTLWAQIYCQLWHARALFWFLNVCSIYSILSIALDRYLAIVHPLRYRYINSSGNVVSFGVIAIKVYQLYTALLIMLIWMLAAALGVPAYPMYHVDEGGYCVYESIEGYTQAFAFVLISLKLFLPILILILIYSHIFLTMGGHQSQPHPTGNVVRVKMARRQMLILSLTITSLYIVCFTPNQAFYFASLLGAPVTYNSPEHIATIVLLYLNSALHPLIYLTSLPSFRKKFKQTLGFAHTHVGPSNDGAVELVDYPAI